MQRPSGVTILAILNFIGAVFLVVCAALFFVGGAFLGAAMQSVVPAGMAAAAGAAIGAILLVFAVLSVATGYGLWTLKPWGRILLIVLAALGLALNVLGLFTGFMMFRIMVFVWRLIVIGIYVVILWYMFQPNVKRAFGEAAPVATATP